MKLNLLESDLSRKSQAYKRTPMQMQRYCYGYCTFGEGRYIAVAGGALDNFSQTDACEFYDTQKDKWAILPRLSKGRYSSAIVLVKDKYLYTIGGHESH